MGSETDLACKVENFRVLKDIKAPQTGDDMTDGCHPKISCLVWTRRRAELCVYIFSCNLFRLSK